jgi:predicted secreted protein
MARFSGTAGAVSVAAGDVAGMSKWSLDQTYAVHQVRGFEDAGVPNKVAGAYDWKGSFSGFKNAAPLTIGTSIALVLEETQTATQKFSGNAIITNLHVEVDTEGAVTYSYEFEGTGALVIPTA